MKKQKLWLQWVPAPAVITSRQWFVPIMVFPTLPRANSLHLESHSPYSTSSNWMSKCFVSSTAAKRPTGKGWECFTLWWNFLSHQKNEPKTQPPPLLDKSRLGGLVPLGRTSLGGHNCLGTPANIVTFPFTGSICSRGGTQPACVLFCVTWSGSADSWDLSPVFQSLNQVS